MSIGSASLRAWLEAPRARPLLLGPSLREVFGPDGAWGEGEASLALALRRSADAIVDLQRAVVDAGVDIVVAPTAGTTAPALQATGQAYRAAALTAAAVDLTRDAVLAAGRPALVVGEVPALSGPRGRAEAHTHVERLLTSAIDGLLVLGDDLDSMREIVALAAEHRLPTVVEVAPAQVRGAAILGATVVVVRGEDAEALDRALDAARQVSPALPIGARMLAPADAADREGAQLAIAAAWSVLGTRPLAIVGVGGRAALGALPALADLSRVSRNSVA